MSTTAKIFMSGRSQALRLPARFRLSTKEVRIEAFGAGLLLHPEVDSTQDMGKWLEQFYAENEALPDSFLSDRQDVAAQERDWE